MRRELVGGTDLDTHLQISPALMMDFWAFSTLHIVHLVLDTAQKIAAAVMHQNQRNLSQVLTQIDIPLTTRASSVVPTIMPRFNAKTRDKQIRGIYPQLSHQLGFQLNSLRMIRASLDVEMHNRITVFFRSSIFPSKHTQSC